MAYREDARPEASPFEEAIAPYLRSDEELLWVDRARAGIVFRGMDAFLIPFSLLWGGFAIFWEVLAIGMGAPAFFACFGMPFVLVGLYLIFGRFLWDMHVRKNTLYAITDHRLLILQRGKLTTMALGRLADLTLTERADGSGRITIGKSPLSYETTGSKSTALEIDEDVRGVYRTIMEAQAALKRTVRARVEEPVSEHHEDVDAEESHSMPFDREHEGHR